MTLIYIFAAILLATLYMPYLIFSILRSNIIVELCLFIISSWVVVILLTIGMFRIRKFSQILIDNNIYCNEKLMATHLISFFAQTLLQSIYCTLEIIQKINHLEDNYKVTYALTILELFGLLTTISVFVTMMIIFLKHNTKQLSDL